MTNYRELFDNVIAPHFHQLVRTATPHPARRIMVHEWVLGIESNWKGFAEATKDGPDYVARLSFWMGGLRDKFYSRLTQEEAEKLLLETFDASTFCYFEYGADDDIKVVIEEYCKKVDKFLGKKLLHTPYQRFKLSHKAIPIIESTTRVVEQYDSNVHVKGVRIDESVQDFESLQRKFTLAFRHIAAAFLEVADRRHSELTEINEDFQNFLSAIGNLGFTDVLTKDQRTRVEDLDKKAQEIQAKRQATAESRQERSREEKWNKHPVEVERPYEGESKESFRERRKAAEREARRQKQDDRRQENRERSREQTPQQKEAPTSKNLLKRFLVKWWWAILALLLVAGFVGAALITPLPSESYELRNETSTVSTLSTYTETVPQEISLKQYIDSKESLSNKPAKVVGYLKHGVYKLPSGGGVYAEMVADKQGNEILLVDLTDEQKTHFLQKSTTENLYEIVGKFRNLADGFKIDVNSIAPTETPMQTVERSKTIQEPITQVVKVPVAQNTTLLMTALWTTKQTILGVCSDGTKRGSCTDVPPGYCNFASIIVDNPDVCGCPDGSREYKGACIPVVKCKDGTLAPECSSSLPNQCIDGKLVPKASVCGCPPDHRKIGDACQKILRCSDGTEYGECTKSKPSYCDNGRIVNNAANCGCPYGTEALDKECVELEYAIEQKIFDLTNNERTSRGLKALRWSDTLANAARAHSKDMATRDYFSHDTPEGKTTLDRFGYGAENIHMMPTGNVEGYGYVGRNSDDLAEAIVDSWMNSPGHRANILNGDLDTLGVGVAYDGSLYYYSTQDFGW